MSTIKQESSVESGGVIYTLGVGNQSDCSTTYTTQENAVQHVNSENVPQQVTYTVTTNAEQTVYTQITPRDVILQQVPTQSYTLCSREYVVGDQSGVAQVVTGNAVEQQQAQSQIVEVMTK